MAQKMWDKVIISGDVIEVYKYEEPVFFDFKKKKLEPDEDEAGEETSEVLEEPEKQENEELLEEIPDNIRHLFDRKKEYRKAAVYRARQTLRRLILANFDHNSKFVTLTFADGSILDVTDVRQANKEFDKFLKRLKRYLKKHDKPKLKYATVVEFQDKNGRGAVHYHLICNLPWIEQSELSRIWRNGWVGINSLRAKMREDGKDVDNVGAYMIKYMIKDFNDPRLKGEKMYFTSKGLNKPIELKGTEAAAFLWLNQFEQKKEAFASEYASEYHGLIQYKEYNLKRSGEALRSSKFLKAQ